MTKSLKELADFVKGELVGEDALIKGIVGLPYAKPGYLTFVDDKKHCASAEKSEASGCIVPPGYPGLSKPVIQVKNPRLAFAQILGLFHERRRREPGIHPTAIIGKNVSMGSGASIAPYVVIDDDVTIGDNVQLYPFVYIDRGVTISDEVTIYPHVSIMRGATVGNRVVIHSGTIIGTDGFGYVKDGHTHVKIPQVGKVIIEDDVEIGANDTIDRATTEATRIGRGTKMDNLIQIGHNTVVGQDCIIVSQAGLAGSITVGDRVTIAAQAGLKDHIEIGSDSILAGRAGVTKSVPPGVLVSGYPAREHRQELRIEAAIQNLPEMVKKLKELEKTVKELSEKA
jgi:UDP-3-O-[3-hydroxymyristoyl] glucosamine N-acyltransferase